MSTWGNSLTQHFLCGGGGTLWAITLCYTLLTLLPVVQLCGFLPEIAHTKSQLLNDENYPIIVVGKSTFNKVNI